MIIKAIDTLEFGLMIENYDENFEAHATVFKELKEKAQSTGQDQLVQFGDLILTVQRTGIPFYAYKLVTKDFSICFMDKSKGDNPPITIRFMSSYLWSFGLNDAIEEFMVWFRNLGMPVIGNKISRLDVCVDTDEVVFKENDVKGVSTRSRNKEIHFVNSEFLQGRVFSGFTFGRGEVLARIYNKTLEIQKSGKVWFYDIWEENGHCRDGDVWRIEFQLRRKALKEFGISVIEDINSNEIGLWAYLTQEWLSIRIPNKDTNASRWKVKPKWRKLQKAHLNYIPSPLIRERIKIGNVKQLLDQASGLLLSIAAVANHESADQTSDVIKSWLEINLQNKKTNYEVEINKRKSRFLKIVPQTIKHNTEA